MDREAIIYQLRRALSQDPQVVKDAEIFINNWKQNALYYTNLYSIFVDTNLENEVRWIAVIEFRNHVDILWRKSGKMTLDAESRKFIRENLLPASESCALPLALQNALIASRIVRIDFPNEWPNFFETLINRANTLLSSNQWELALRHFITLHHAVKVLGSNRLPRSRLIFQQIAPQLLDFLVSVVFPLAENWLTNINNADSDARVALNWIASITRYGLKTSRRLIPGFRDLNSSTPAQSFFKNGLQLYSNVVSYLESQGQKQASLDDNFHQIVWKHALVINKIFIDLAEYPPMLSSLNYTKDYLMAFTEVINHTGLLFKTADESLFDFVELFSKLSVLCIRSLSHVLTELTDGTTLTSESTQSMYVELFNQEYVSQLFIVLVTAFVVLRKNDFEEWKDDPEHWVTEQLSEDVGYNIRPSAEHLVQCLFTLFKNLLIPQLQVSLSAVSQLPSSFENVIEQDAILSIIGASAESIQDIFQFEPWFLSIYNGLSDVQDVNISLVFRRRVSILISQFAPFVSNEDTIRLIYSLLPKFLTDSPCNDCVVKLTALRAYKDILDDYNFKDSCFAAVRDEVTQSMINLAPSFDVAESRQLVLDSLTALLNRLGKSVTPYAETIVNLLLQLWTDWEEEGILRAGTVSVMSVFVNAIKTGAEPFHFVLSRIVECSTNLDSDDHVMLETDGLELWAACLQNTTTLSEHFSHLFPNIIRYLSLGTSTLPFVLTVFNSYMLLEPTLLSGDVATYTLTQFRLLMDDVKNETFEFLSYSLSMLLMNCPMENISEPLVASGLLSMEITKVLENKEHPVKLSSCCLFLSRLAFRSPDLIILVCDQASADGSAMTKLVENWIQLYDHISSPGNRKLCILGLTSLLPSNHTGVLQNMNPLMHLWFSGLSEVEEDANGDAQIYYKNEDMSEFGFYLDPQTAEAKRKELMISQDAVHTVSLKSFISQAFTGCAQHYGGLEAFRASCLQNVDSALLDQFSTML